MVDRKDHSSCSSSEIGSLLSKIRYTNGQCCSRLLGNYISVYLVFTEPFLPEASFCLRVLSLPAYACVCVRLSVNHQLVRVVTHQTFKLESLNLDQRCKRLWLRSLLCVGTMDFELQGQIELKSQNLPHFELVRAISHHQLKSVFPNFGQKCTLALLRSLLILGWTDLDVLFCF